VKLFGFIHRLPLLDECELSSAALDLAKIYPHDLGNEIVDEVIQFKNYLKLDTFIDSSKNTTQSLLKMIVDNHIMDVFNNVYVALRISLMIPVANCEAELSFSKLILIKNKLRTCMVESRLNNLTLL